MVRVRLTMGGLVGALAVSAGPALALDYAPLDCGKAHSPAQETICSAYALGQSEACMATLFEVTTSLVGMGQRGDIRDQQAEFLRRREECKADVACLGSAYRAAHRSVAESDEAGRRARPVLKGGPPSRCG